jgi:hypothetical protein
MIAFRIHQAGGDYVVTAQAVLPHEPTDPAAQRQSTHTRRRDHTAGRGKPEFLALAIEYAPGRTALGRAVCFPASTWTSRIRERSIIMAPSATDFPYVPGLSVLRIFGSQNRAV